LMPFPQILLALFISFACADFKSAGLSRRASYSGAVLLIMLLLYPQYRMIRWMKDPAGYQPGSVMCSTELLKLEKILKEEQAEQVLVLDCGVIGTTYISFLSRLNAEPVLFRISDMKKQIFQALPDLEELAGLFRKYREEHTEIYLFRFGETAYDFSPADRLYYDIFHQVLNEGRHSLLEEEKVRDQTGREIFTLSRIRWSS
ncbi:MAG TPA: hypothetical protein VJC03_07405, partial [bacterium]|nr:hypothetical protein [bacterium]